MLFTQLSNLCLMFPPTTKSVLTPKIATSEKLSSLFGTLTACLFQYRLIVSICYLGTIFVVVTIAFA